MIPKGVLTFKYMRLKCAGTQWDLGPSRCDGSNAWAYRVRPAAGIGCPSAKERKVQDGRNEPASGFSYMAIYALKQTSKNKNLLGFM